MLYRVTNASPETFRDRVEVRAVISSNATLGDADDIQLFTTTRLMRIPAGGQTSINHRFRLPDGITPGSYELLVAVDPLNTITEVDEADNVFTAATPVIFEHERVELSAALDNVRVPDTAMRDDRISARLAVTNIGNIRHRDTFNIRLIARPNQGGPDVVLSELHRQLTLNPDRPARINLRVTLPDLATDTYQIVAAVVASDPSIQTSTEASTSMNAVAAFVDLRGSIDTLRFREPISPGSRGSVRFTVSNEGNYRMRSRVAFNVILSQDETIGNADDVLMETRTQNLSLLPGRNRLVTIPATVPSIEVASYRVMVQIDSEDSVQESNESNNIATGETLAIQWPDIAPTFHRTPSRDPLIAGRRETVTVTLTNLGTGDAIGTGTVTLFASETGSLEGAVHLAEIDRRLRLRPGRSTRLSLRFVIPESLAGKSIHFVAVLSSTDLIETNEINNVGGSNTLHNIAP